MLDNIRHLSRLGMGEAQRYYGLTARALRYYEQTGLLRAQRDKYNCRCFDGEARRRLGWIAALRSAGVALRDVQDVLFAEDRDGLGGQVALAKLEWRRKALMQQIAAVDALSTALKSGATATEIQLEALRSAS